MTPPDRALRHGRPESAGPLVASTPYMSSSTCRSVGRRDTAVCIRIDRSTRVCNVALLSTVVSFVLLSSACASLGGLGSLVQAPTFTEARDQPAEITLQPPSASRPLGGAAVRLWTEVGNPNAFGLSLGTLDGTLYLDGQRAAIAAFPLGLRLAARDSVVVPIDLAISFADVPGLADVVRRAVRRETVGYRLDGTIGVDAGGLGQPTFGPMTLMRGDLR